MEPVRRRHPGPGRRHRRRSRRRHPEHGPRTRRAADALLSRAARVPARADAGSIVGMIVRQALLPTLIGAAVGAGGAAAAGAMIRSRLYGAAPVDPLAFGSATLLMLTVMLLASWIPARHAGQVDPISVLRQE